MRSVTNFFCVMALLFMLPCSINAQSRQVSGTITDSKGGPVPLATVQLKGTNNATSADDNGKFTIGISGENPVLVISSAGFVTQEISIGAAATYTVSMQESGTLSEVVVTALGISKRQKSLGYATQQVKAENLTFSKEQNVMGALAGKIAGVQVIGSSGASMGGTQKIKIRGYNSISGLDQPLVVVDGTPVSNANFAGADGPDLGNAAQDINPDDIESVNVLKGPAATALYGLRGQFGVLMITTKKGRANQKAQVEFSSAFTADRAGNFMPLQNVYGGGTSQTFSTVNINGVATPYVSNADESWGPKMDGQLVRHRNSWYPLDPYFGQAQPFVAQPDNIKDYFETGLTFNNSISVTGGSQQASFRLSYNNTDIQGIEPNTYLKRNNISLNTSLKVTDKITASASINYGNNKAQRPDQGYTHSSSRYFLQWFQRSLNMNTLKNYKYADGRFLQWNGSNPTNATVGSLSFLNNKPSDWNNPYFNVYENPNNDSRDRYFGNISLTYAPIRQLKLSGAVRSDIYIQNIETRKGIGGFDVNGFSTGKYQNKEMNYEFIAQYDETFNDFSLTAIAGTNLYHRRYDYLYQATVGGLSTPNFFNIEGSVDRPVVNNYLDRKRIFSWFTTATVGYKDLIFVDASFRQDYTSTLPGNNNGYSYPSVSTSFIFSELLKAKAISFGKLRLSLARAGSDIGTQLTSNPYAIAINGTITSAYLPNILNNPNLQPSFADAFEAGLNMQFLDNRIGFDLTYYKQNNKKQAITLDISGSTGYTGTVVNAGNIENKGFEIAVNGVPVRTNKFTWNTQVNFAGNKSKVIELIPEYEINNRILSSNTYSGVSVYVNAEVGKAYGTLIGRGYRRDPKTNKILLGANNMPLYEDNHEFGNIVPDLTGGWINTFRFGKFDLSALVDFQKGGMFFSWTKMLAVKSGQAAETAATNGNGKNVRDPVADGGGVWVSGISEATGQEVNAYVDGKVYYRSTLGTHVYEEWAFDASYIKLREVKLGYTFSINKSRFKINSINFSVFARNPWMIWQKAPEGLDPSELSAGGSLSWLEKGQLQTVRSFGCNLNIKF